MPSDPYRILEIPLVKRNTSRPGQEVREHPRNCTVARQKCFATVCAKPAYERTRRNRSSPRMKKARTVFRTGHSMLVLTVNVRLVCETVAAHQHAKCFAPVCSKSEQLTLLVCRTSTFLQARITEFKEHQRTMSVMKRTFSMPSDNEIGKAASATECAVGRHL